MTLETAFKRFAFLPSFIQTGNGEPRRAHFLGKNEATPIEQKQDRGGKNDQEPKRPSPGKYRDLASITLGEVEDAYNYYRDQLVRSPIEGWITKNSFCQIPLKSRGTDRPPVVFGRVKTCYPSDGDIHNIEMMEIYFPRRAEPDLLYLRPEDIALQKPIQSYCVGVKCYISVEEMRDFSQSENIFVEKGFAPLYENGYIELLDLREQNQSTLSWLYVIGSGWFASIPDSVQGEVREQLRKLVRWNKLVFNYHPRRYSLQYRSLNEELDYQYGFTEHFLVTPQDTAQVLNKLDESVAAILMRGIK